MSKAKELKRSIPTRQHARILASVAILLLLTTSCSSSNAERVGVVLGRNADDGARFLDDVERLGVTLSADEVATTVESNESFLDRAVLKVGEIAADIKLRQQADAIMSEAMCSVFIESAATGQFPTVDDISRALIFAGLSQGDVGLGVTTATEFVDLTNSTSDDQVLKLRILMLQWKYCPA